MPYGTYSLTQHVRSGPIISGLRLSEDGGNSLLKDIYQPFVNPNAETLVFNANIRWTFLGMLGFLQCITIAWFVLIVNVVIKVLRGEGAEDTRSDDEGDDEEEIEEEEEELEAPGQGSVPFYPASGFAAEEEKQYIEVEADSSDLHYNSTASKPRSAGSSSAKRKGFSSGLNLGERKEILNRIGCLSDEQLAREKEKRADSASPRR